MAMKQRMDRTAVTSLTVQAKQWPTPKASEGFRGTDPARPNHTGGASLMATAKDWPTPTAHDPKDLGAPPSQQERHSPGLATVVSTHGHQDETTTTDGPNGSPKVDLNPRFVEALMGVPQSWLTPSTSVETGSYQQWLRLHSLSLRRGSVSTSEVCDG